MSTFLDELKSAAPGVDAIRYLSAIGLAAMYYDYFLTLGDEIEYIWTTPRTTLNTVFLVLRYGVGSCNLFFVYMLTGFTSHLHQRVCSSWVISITLVGLGVLILANYIMIQRLYTLWDRRPHVIKKLVAGYCVTVVFTITIFTFNSVQLQEMVRFDDLVFHICIIQKKPRLWALGWASQVSFDVFALILTLLNAAERPRKSDEKIIEDLQRDGLLFYLALFGLRFLNFVLGLSNDPSVFLIAVPFDFSMTTITITRLILRVEIASRTQEDESLPLSDTYRLNLLSSA